MRRILKTIAISFLLAAVLCPTALADVIWEPFENSFYNTHREDMEYLNRDFYANGQEGYLELFTKPGGNSLGFAKNGETFNISYVYTDEVGEGWGLVQYTEKGEFLVNDSYGENNAYVKIADTLQKYDVWSFDEEFGDEFSPYDGDYSEFSGALVLWSYPNSGEITANFEETTTDHFNISDVYTDDNGRVWGRVSYYYGVKNSWVCISEPANTTIAARETDAPVFHEATSDNTPEPTDENSEGINLTVIAIALLAVAIALTLILTLNKKKPK